MCPMAQIRTDDDAYILQHTFAIKFWKVSEEFLAETKCLVRLSTNYVFTSIGPVLLYKCERTCGWESFCDRRPDC